MHQVHRLATLVAGTCLLALSTSASANWVIANKCVYLQNLAVGPNQYNYLSAEFGYTGRYWGEIRARTSSGARGPWEKFIVWRNGWYARGIPIAFQSAWNGKFIALEATGYYGNYGAENGLLRARTPQNNNWGQASDIGAWETFHDPNFSVPDTSYLQSTAMDGYLHDVNVYNGTTLNANGQSDAGMLTGGWVQGDQRFYFNYLPCDNSDVWQ